MIPFPGESVWISDAADITAGTDFSLYNDVVHREGSRTLAAGSSWRLFVYSADMDYAEDAIDGTVQWAVEVLSGTVTLTAAEGIDPTYSGYTSPLGTPLGSHTVTGPATLLIDSTFTADQVADLDGSVSAAFRLGLTATSGSAVVQQVKLRVWPTGGAHGAFVTFDAFDTAPVAAQVRVTTDTEVGQSGSVTVGDTEGSWDAAASAVVADITTGPYSFSAVTATGSGPHVQVGAGFLASQSNLDGTNIQTQMTAAPLVGVAVGLDWSTQFPLGPDAPLDDLIRPPEEVRDEDEAYLYPQLGTGSVGWLNAGVVIEQTGQAAAVVPALTFATASDDTPTITGPGFLVDVTVDIGGGELPAPTAGSTLTSSHALPTDARYLFAHIGHAAVRTAAPWPGTFPGSPTDSAVVTGILAQIHFGTGDPAGTFAPIRTYAHMPPYQVWLPDAAPVVVRKLRQLHRDDGLGVAPPRAFGGASRIRTGRAYGYD